MPLLQPSARAQQAVANLSIEAQEVSEALYWFSYQTGVGMILPPGFPRTVTRAPLRGPYSHAAALRILLRGMEYEAEFVSPQIVRIVRKKVRLAPAT